MKYPGTKALTCLLLATAMQTHAVKPHDHPHDDSIFIDQREKKQKKKANLLELKKKKKSRQSFKKRGKIDDASVLEVIKDYFTDFNSDFEVIKIQQDKRGNKHYRVQQVYQGYKVIGGDLVISVNSQGEIFRTNGRPQNSFSIPSDIISKAQARQSAKVDLTREQQKSQLKTTLVIFNGKLAYEIEIGNEYDHKIIAYVDAESGETILRYQSSMNVSTPMSGNLRVDEGGALVNFNGELNNGNYTLENLTEKWSIGTIVGGTQWGTWPFSSPNFGNTQPTKVSLAYNMSLSQQFTSSFLGFNSYDNQNAFALAHPHYVFNPGTVNQTTNNAAYLGGNLFVFGDGDGSIFSPLTSLDVVAHEFAHAITGATSQLAYLYESGALNESYSDIYGFLVENNFQPDGKNHYPDDVPGESDWLIGEDVTIAEDALRDMRDPHRFNNPSYYKGTYWHFNNSDNGGVHINSGVQNMAFYLLAEGSADVNHSNDSHPINVQGIGITQAGEIAMYANTYLLTSESDFHESFQAWIDAANILGYSAQAVEDAWKAVGIPQQMAPVGTSLWLPFDELNGNITPAIYGPNGTVTGSLSTIQASGVDFGAFDFSQGEVVVPHSNAIDIGGTKDFSIAFWINTTSLVPGWYERILDKSGPDGSGPNSSFTISMYKGAYNLNGGYVQISMSNGYYPALYQHINVPINDGQWHHVVLNFERTQGNYNYVTTYIDGSYTSYFSGPSINVNNTGDLLIGRRNSSNPLQLQATLDELMIIQRKLGDQEITNLYQGGLNGFGLLKNIPNESPLYFYQVPQFWVPFDQNFGIADETVDLVGNLVVKSTTGNMTFEAEKVCNSISLSNADSLSVDDHSNIELNGDFTMSFWLKSGDEMHTNLIEKKSTNGDYFNMAIVNQGKVIVNYMNNSTRYYTYVADELISKGDWKHIAVTRSAATNTFKIYVDGQLANSTTYNYGVYNTPDNYDLRIHPSGPINIDQLMIQQRVLTGNEIQNEFFSGSTGFIVNGYTPTCL